MERFETVGRPWAISGGKEHTTLDRTSSKFGELRACATLKLLAHRHEFRKDKGHRSSRRPRQIFRGVRARDDGTGAEGNCAVGEVFERAHLVVAVGVECAGKENSGRHPRAARAECAFV